MTPTAMLADYVLPGDVFSERNHIADSWSWSTRLSLSQKSVEPAEGISSSYEFWKDLAKRFDFGNRFPWETIEDVLDYRLSRSGRTFADFEATGFMEMQTPNFGNIERRGLRRHREG